MNHAAILNRQWVHIVYPEAAQFKETYGFVGSQGTINLEGLLIEPEGQQRSTVYLLMHPSSTLQLLPLPSALARAGCSVLCMGSRYVKNDAPLIYEKVALDLGACIRHAKEILGFRRVILLGWSGGGSLSLFYQAQAERPTITETPAGDPVDLTAAKLPPADGVILEAAHQSRAVCLSQWIDPSVVDENDPDSRDLRFDIYSPECPVQMAWTSPPIPPLAPSACYPIQGGAWR